MISVYCYRTLVVRIENNNNCRVCHCDRTPRDDNINNVETDSADGDRARQDRSAFPPPYPRRIDRRLAPIGS